MNTLHHGEPFHLHFRMSKPKQSGGLHNRSALVILNITEMERGGGGGGVCWRNERLGEERQSK